MQLVWVLFLTSEENSGLHAFFNSGGSGGMSGNARRNRRMDSGFAGESGYGAATGGISNRGISNLNSPINGGGYSGYAPAATDHTPQKIVPPARDDFHQSPPPSDEQAVKSRAK